MRKRVVAVPMWDIPMGFDEWKMAVGAIARARHPDETLWRWHGMCIDAAHVVDIPVVDGTFILRAVPRDMWPNKRARVALDIERVQQRFALALWKECNRLMARRMTMDARKLVIETRDKMVIAARIEVHGG